MGAGDATRVAEPVIEEPQCIEVKFGDPNPSHQSSFINTQKGELSKSAHSCDEGTVANERIPAAINKKPTKNAKKGSKNKTEI